jgi:hypothetical protein
MCDPITLAVTAGAAGLNAAGQSSQKKANARAMNANTELSASEFNARDKLAREIFTENTSIDQQTYNALAALSDEEFATRTGLSKEAFNQLDQIDRQQVIRDAAAADVNTAQTRDIRFGRDAARDAASAEYDATLSGANTTQDAYRSQADAIARGLVEAFSADAMAGRRGASEADRNNLVNLAVGSAPTPTGNAMTAKYVSEGRAKGMAEAALGSRIGSQTDALGKGNTVINRGNEGTAFVQDAARRSLAPLSAKLGASSLKYNNAADAASQRGAASDADLEAALNLSGTRATGERRGVTDYTGAMDSAYGAFFGNKGNTVGARGDALIGANDAKLAGTNSVSSAFEGNMRGINDFRAANTFSTFGTLGQVTNALVGPVTDWRKSVAAKKAATAGVP